MEKTSQHLGLLLFLCLFDWFEKHKHSVFSKCLLRHGVLCLCCSVCWFLYGPFCHVALKFNIEHHLINPLFINPTIATAPGPGYDSKTTKKFYFETRVFVDGLVQKKWQVK